VIKTASHIRNLDKYNIKLINLTLNRLEVLPRTVDMYSSLLKRKFDIISSNALVLKITFKLNLLYSPNCG